MSDQEYDALRQKILNLGSRGQIFRIQFRRRTDKIVGGKVISPAGTLRVMTCRLHVRKGVKGVTDRITADRAARCFTVYEMRGEHSQFKRIPAEGIVGVSR